MRKRLQRRGNGTFLLLTTDLLAALRLEGATPGGLEVEMELTSEGLLIRPVDGLPVTTVLPPRWAGHPATRELLLAVRDLGPIRTAPLAELLGRTREATSSALSRAHKQGATQPVPHGWTLTDTARSWYAHVPPTGLAPASTRKGERRTKGSLEDVILAALSSIPLTSSEVGEATSMDRSQAHNLLKRLAAAGRVVAVPGWPVRWQLP